MIIPSTFRSQHPNQEQLHGAVHELRAQGMSYRQIANALGIHWTRIGQILRRMKSADK